MQIEFSHQEQNDPNILPVYNDTTVYNAIESTATENVPKATNKTRPTSECHHRYAAGVQSK